MPTITRSRLQTLATAAGWPRISIYLPTHRARPDVAQDPVRFRQLVDEAAHRLDAGGATPAVRDRVLAPARELLGDAGFWSTQLDGLAVLLGDGAVEMTRLPFAVPPLAVAGDRWHLKPLLRALDGIGRFSVLSLSQHAVRLFEADDDAIREVALEGLPHDLRDVMGWDWQPDSLQFHAASRQGQGTPTAMFHGHGAPHDGHDGEIREFLRAVDGRVAAHLAGAETPLVLAGVRSLTAAYREHSAVSALLAPAIDGNPDELSAHQLHQRALAVMAGIPSRAVRRAESRFEEMAGGPLATTDLETILPAALDGRVDTLLVDLATARWGRWDEAERRAEVHVERDDGDVDLLDVAAVLVLGTGSEIHALRSGWRHAATGVAAVLRY